MFFSIVSSTSAAISFLFQVQLQEVLTRAFFKVAEAWCAQVSLVCSRSAGNVFMFEIFCRSGRQRRGLTRRLSALIFLIMEHVNQPVCHLVHFMRVVTRRQNEEEGWVRVVKTKGPSVPTDAQFGPRRSGRRRPSGESRPAVNIPRRWTGKGIGSAWPSIPPASASSRASLWSLTAVTARVTTNQHAGPCKDPGLAPCPPSTYL